MRGVLTELFLFCSSQNREPELGVNAVLNLLEKVDEYIPLPKRELEKPFLLPIEGVCSIPGMKNRQEMQHEHFASTQNLKSKFS